ncbi:MAG: cation transporter, partial [Azonexaceae bacterium]|nr:cation transporter [Azonexaceae bacterium]
MERSSLTRFAWLSIVAAIVPIGLTAGAYYLTGSVGLLSDALESLVNLVAAMMALAMLIVAARPPDERHHFGHSKAEYFASGLEGAFKYLQTYPYTCWEQRITKAVGASFYHSLRPYLDKAFAWDGSQELVGKTLALAAEHQAPNGGMAYFVPRDEYVDPYLSAFTALAFNWLRQKGWNPPGPVQDKL